MFRLEYVPIYVRTKKNAAAGDQQHQSSFVEIQQNNNRKKWVSTKLAFEAIARWRLCLHTDALPNAITKRVEIYMYSVCYYKLTIQLSVGPIWIRIEPTWLL